MEEQFKLLTNEDNNRAFHALMNLEILCTNTDDLMIHFNDLLDFLNSNKSFIRVRGFRLICALSKWDKDNLIEKNFDKIFKNFNSDNGTEIRQYLKYLNQMLLYKTDLNEEITKKLNLIDPSIFKDGIGPLIEKDVKNILERM